MASIGSEKITVSTTTKRLDATLREAAENCRIVVQTESIYFEVDGNIAEAADSELADEGDTIVLRDKDDMRRFRAIRGGDTDAALNVKYFDSGV